MMAVADQDQAPLERWAGMRDAETAVVWDVHLGGYPVCLVGMESRPTLRMGFVPADGPDEWSAGTLFPLSSKKSGSCHQRGESQSTGRGPGQSVGV